MRTTVGMRIDHELHRKFKILAFSVGRPMADIMEEIMAEWIRRTEKTVKPIPMMDSVHVSGGPVQTTVQKTVGKKKKNHR